MAFAEGTLQLFGETLDYIGEVAEGFAEGAEVEEWADGRFATDDELAEALDLGNPGATGDIPLWEEVGPMGQTRRLATYLFKISEDLNEGFQVGGGNFALYRRFGVAGFRSAGMATQGQTAWENIKQQAIENVVGPAWTVAKISYYGMTGILQYFLRPAPPDGNTYDPRTIAQIIIDQAHGKGKWHSLVPFELNPNKLTR
jgi:hypothetical protein